MRKQRSMWWELYMERKKNKNRIPAFSIKSSRMTHRNIYLFFQVSKTHIDIEISINLFALKESCRAL